MPNISLVVKNLQMWVQRESKYVSDEFSQTNGGTVSCFRLLTEDDLLQLHNT